LTSIESQNWLRSVAIACRWTENELTKKKMRISRGLMDDMVQSGTNKLKERWSIRI
jgi:hypothetical protein